MNIKRIINAVLVGLFFGAIPLAIMWLTGYDFVRSTTLGFTSFCSILIFLCTFAIAVAEVKEQP